MIKLLNSIFLDGTPLTPENNLEQMDPAVVNMWQFILVMFIIITVLLIVLFCICLKQKKRIDELKDDLEHLK